MDDVPSLPVNFPTNVDVSASGSYHVEHKKLTFDSKVFPPCTQKIEDVGKLKKKKFAIECDGYGHMKLREMMSPFEKIEKLAKLLEKNIITQEEFDTKKKQIIDEEI